MENNIITIFDERGQATEMEVVATLKVARQDYAILHAIATDEDEIFAVEENGDQQKFSLVEDEGLRQEIVDAYYDLVD